MSVQTELVDSIDGPAEQTPTLWRALRANPTRAADVSVLYAVPQLSPHVARWWQNRRLRRPDDEPEAVARRVLRRAAGVARRGGIITGSSFYVGMGPAMAMIYCEQLALVLRIATVYGRDPLAPTRAAEILVLQGRYDSVTNATKALRIAGQPAEQRAMASETRTVAEAARQLPSMIGLQVRKFSHRSPLDVLIALVEVASFVIPIVSIPVWAVANARATRRLGRAAIAFYSRPEAADHGERVVLLRRPARRTYRLFFAALVPLALALGVVVTILPGGKYQHGLHWVGFVIGEVSLVLIFARLIRITRVEPPSTSGS
jgi:hypothetical protein